MATLLFSNDSLSSLADAVGAADTSIRLVSGGGAQFPDPGPNEYFVAQFLDAATGERFEIVHVTARTGDVLTVLRAQEGTSAQNWLIGDAFAATVTAGVLQGMLQEGDGQIQSGNYAQDVGTANAYFAPLSPGLNEPAIGMPVRVKIANANTGPATLNMGSGVRPVVTAAGTPLPAYTLRAGRVYEFIYDGVNYQLTSQSWPVSNYALDPMSEPGFLGRFDAGAGVVQYLTPALAAGLLPEFTQLAKGLVPAFGSGGNDRVLTPAGWGSFVETTTTVSGSSVKIGGKIHLQTGWALGMGPDTSRVVLFPQAFANAPQYYGIWGLNRGVYIPTEDFVGEVEGTPSTTQMTVICNRVTGAPTGNLNWFALRID